MFELYFLAYKFFSHCVLLWVLCSLAHFPVRNLVFTVVYFCFHFEFELPGGLLRWVPGPVELSSAVTGLVSNRAQGRLIAVGLGHTWVNSSWRDLTVGCLVVLDIFWHVVVCETVPYTSSHVAAPTLLRELSLGFWNLISYLPNCTKSLS